MSEQGKNIVVGYDGSSESRAAVHWAASVAQRRGRPLVVATAAGVDPGSELVREAEALSREGAEQARKSADIEVTAQSPGSGVVASLVKLSEDAELVVMGNRGRGRLRGSLMGSAAFSVAIHAQCPVAITRDTVRGLPSKDLPIVVGTDGSESSDAAVAEAARLASETGALLKIVVAYDAPSNTPWLVAQYPDDVTGEQAGGENVWQSLVFEDDGRGSASVQRRAEAGKFAHRAAEVATELYPGLSVELSVISGRPERAIVEAAIDASLIVVGARGRGDFASLLLGSVSRDVMQHADCTVYVVR